MHNFTVEGFDAKDGSHTELAGFASRAEAIEWLRRYASKENAGNWDLVEIYDVRDPEDVTRVYYWDRGCEGE